MKQQYLKQVFKRYRFLIRKSRASHRMSQILPNPLIPNKYDCLNKKGEPIRISEEYLYKLILRNNDDNCIGYEFYKMQHKNQLRNKLKRAFRRMLFIQIHTYFNQMCSVEDQQILDIEGEDITSRVYDFKKILVEKIKKFLLRKQRLDIINQLEQQELIKRRSSGMYNIKVKDQGYSRESSLEKLLEDHGDDGLYKVNIDYTPLLIRQLSIDRIVLSNQKPTKDQTKRRRLIQLASNMFESESSHHSKQDPMIKREILKLKDKIIREYSIKQVRKDSIEEEKQQFYSDIKYEFILRSLESDSQDPSSRVKNRKSSFNKVMKNGSMQEVSSSSSDYGQSIYDRKPNGNKYQSNLRLNFNREIFKIVEPVQSSSNIDHRVQHEIIVINDYPQIGSSSQIDVEIENLDLESQRVSDSITSEKSKLVNVVRNRVSSFKKHNKLALKPLRLNSNFFEKYKQEDQKMISISQNSVQSHLIPKQIYNSFLSEYSQSYKVEDLIIDHLNQRQSNLALHLLKTTQNLDLEHQDAFGNTFLNLAAQQGEEKIVKYLVSKLVDLNTTNKQGNTPQHYARMNKNSDIEEFLKQSGSNAKIKNKPSFDAINKVKSTLKEQNKIVEGCNPSQIKVKLETQGDGATEKQIKDLINSPSGLQLVRVLETGFKTLDGRIQGSYLATPGGDSGEFILGLQIYADMKLATTGEVHLTQAKVKNLLKDYLQIMKQPRFYLATDDRAIQHIEKQLNIIGLDIINPKKKVQEQVLKIIAQPENQGDLHIKLLLQEPQNYSVNKTIIEYFIQSYYQLLWDKEAGSLSDKLELEVLAGDHDEQAFVEIKTDMECLRNNRAPLLSSHNDDNSVQVFINHMDAVTLVRAQIAKFFTQHVGHESTKADTETMFNRMNHMGMAFLEHTGSYIAKYLNFYTVNLV
eukprot:403361163